MVIHDLVYGEPAHTIEELDRCDPFFGLVRYVFAEHVYYVFTGNMHRWKSMHSSDKIIGKVTININR